jgi:hypothetical protein
MIGHESANVGNFVYKREARLPLPWPECCTSKMPNHLNLLTGTKVHK